MPGLASRGVTLSSFFWKCYILGQLSCFFKGVLHPRPVFWLFMHCFQKLQHIGKGCFTIRVHLQKLHSSPVLTIEAYFDFKVLLPKHWSGLGLPTAIKRRLESINFSKKICSFVMILPKIAVPFGFSQILCSSYTWNKHKEFLFVNSGEIIWTRPFKI